MSRAASLRPSALSDVASPTEPSSKLMKGSAPASGPRLTLIVRASSGQG
jgi:hypothetical protein